MGEYAQCVKPGNHQWGEHVAATRDHDIGEIAIEQIEGEAEGVGR